MRQRKAMGIFLAGALVLIQTGTARADSTSSGSFFDQLIQAVNSSDPGVQNGISTAEGAAKTAFQAFSAEVDKVTGPAFPDPSTGSLVPPPAKPQPGDDPNAPTTLQTISQVNALEAASQQAAMTAVQSRNTLRQARNSLLVDVINRLDDVANAVVNQVVPANKSYDDLVAYAQKNNVTPPTGTPDKQSMPQPGQQADLSQVDGPVKTAVSNAHTAIDQYQAAFKANDSTASDKLKTAQQDVQSALDAVNTMRKTAAGELGYLVTLKTADMNLVHPQKTVAAN